jgi:hypothetical protein
VEKYPKNMLKSGFLLVVLILSGFVFIGCNFAEAQQTGIFPSWLKNTLQWWNDGQISDDEFLNIIKYLIDNKIIHNTTSVSEVLHIISWKPNVTGYQQGDYVVIKSDGLPDHATGNFPNQYNPNSIQKQNYEFKIPLNPQIASQTTSLPMGPIGIMLNGVVFFNPYNAQHQDAVKVEVFDDCNGHPDMRGSYHYHQLSPCIVHDTFGAHSPLIGYAFDGFPIYGLDVTGGIPTTDLDSCNGHYDSVRGYHYHATKEFPYLIGCYKGVVSNVGHPHGNGPGNGFPPGPPPPRY